MLITGVGLGALWFVWPVEANIAPPPVSVLPKVEVLAEAVMVRVTYSDTLVVQCLFTWREYPQKLAQIYLVKCPEDK